MNPANNHLLIYLWLLGVSLAAGLLGYLRAPKRRSATLKAVALHLFTGIFAGYIAFELLEIAEGLRGLLHARVALAGVAAFMGEEALLVIFKRVTSQTSGGGEGL